MDNHHPNGVSNEKKVNLWRLTLGIAGNCSWGMRGSFYVLSEIFPGRMVPFNLDGFYDAVEAPHATPQPALISGA